MNNNKFRDSLSSGKFTVTAEIGPPKGTDITEMKEDILLLKDKVDGLNVTDNQSANMRLSSLGASAVIKQLGAEPVFQITCRDRNRMAIGSDLLAASALGINNVLALTGDYFHAGDHKTVKPVFDIDSVQLTKGISDMNKGFDLGGNQLENTTSFFIGGAFSPSASPEEPQMIKLMKKVNAGMEFIQTQAIFSPDELQKLKNHPSVQKNRVSILAGILLVTGPGMARFVNQNISGIHVPEGIIKRLSGAPKGKRLSEGIKIAGELIKELKDSNVCNGVHIMAIGKEKKVPEIMEKADLL